MVPTKGYLNNKPARSREYPNDVSYAAWRFFANHYKMQEKFMHWDDIRESNPDNINKLDESEERENVCNALGELNLD